MTLILWPQAPLFGQRSPTYQPPMQSIPQGCSRRPRFHRYGWSQCAANLCFEMILWPFLYFFFLFIKHSYVGVRRQERTKKKKKKRKICKSKTNVGFSELFSFSSNPLSTSPRKAVIYSGSLKKLANIS